MYKDAVYTSEDRVLRIIRWEGYHEQ